MAVQMDSLRGLLVIRRMDIAPNGQIRKMYGLMKGMDEKIDKMLFNVSTILKEWVIAKC